MKSHDVFLSAWSGQVVDLIFLVSSPDIEDRSLQFYCEEEEVVFWVVFIFNLKSISYFEKTHTQPKQIYILQENLHTTRKFTYYKKIYILKSI